MKKLVLGILVSGFSFLSSIPFVQAQGNPSTPLNWQCMSIKQTGGHTVELTSKSGNIYSAASDAYVVECISSDNGAPRCTTGDTSIDGVLGLPGPGLGTEFRVTHTIPIPAKVEANGNSLTGEAFSWTTDGPVVNHTYFVVQAADMSSLTAKDANLKFSSFYPTNADTNCASLRWDPTGFIFDSKTLEPIPDLEISIRDAQGALAKVDTARGEINPMKTTKSGQYTFNVLPGFYSLAVQSPSYIFPSVKNPLPFQSDPLFPYTIHKRFLPTLPVDYMLYWGGVFYEKPFFLMVRDIPVDAKTTVFSQPAAITDLTYILDKAGNRYKYSGGTTHPDAIITTPDGSKAIAERGRFEFYIPTSNIQNAQKVTLFVDKSPLMIQAAALGSSSPDTNRGIRLFDNSVQGTTGTQFTIEPILNYLEGYAYNSTNSIVPNATITVYITNANKAFYQTTADNTGFFRISSDKLPALPYYLVITGVDGKSFAQTTSQFATYNEEYAANNGIDYGLYQADPTIPSYQPPAASGKSGNSSTPGGTGGIPGGSGQTGNQTGSQAGSAQSGANQGQGKNISNETGNSSGTDSGQKSGGFWNRLFGRGSNTTPQAGASSQTRQQATKNNVMTLAILSFLLILCIGTAIYLYRKKKQHEQEMTGQSQI